MRKNKKTGLIICIIVVVLLCVLAVLYEFNKRHQKNSEAEIGPEESSNAYSVTYQGKKYKYNTDIKAILFLGVDNRDEIEPLDTPGYAGQSDTIILFVLNTADKTTTVLEVSRDIITDIKIYDMSGEYLATEKAQIALQYAYGDGAYRSCQLSKNAVSALLYDAPIRSYLSLNIDGIAAIVDALGGVKITVPEDYTVIDPAFTEGAEVVLNGSQAEAYVRYRDKTVTGSNNARMERQTQFLTALISQMKAVGTDDIYTRLMDSAGDYLLTDMSADEMNQLSEYELQNEFLKVPGEVRAGEEHDEFIVDDEKLYEIMLNLFYKPVS